MIDPGLIRRYQTTIARIRTRTEARALQIWSIAGGVSDAELAVFLEAIAPLVDAGQQATVATVTAYMSTAVDQSLDAPDLPDLTLRTGIDAAEVYTRPVITARTALSEGRARSAALELGRQRLGHLVTTDLQLAHRSAAQRTMSDAGVVGYRRTLTSQSCALCATASTVRYRTDQLMPIHDHCDCGVAPIVGDRDPGQIINRDLLRELRSAGGSDYWTDRNLRVTEDGRVLRPDDTELTSTVEEHGEKGPWLVEAGHQFTQL